LQVKVKELERMVGRLTMENVALKEMLKLIEPKKSHLVNIYIKKIILTL